MHLTPRASAPTVGIMTSGVAAEGRGRTMTGRWAAVVALLLVGATAAAAEPNRSVDRAYHTGIELRRHGDDRGALREFRRAYAAAPNPRTLAQIGLAEQALGIWVDAEAHLGEALNAVGDSWIATNRAALQQALQSVAAHLGTLEVECDTTGVALEINGVPAGSLPLQRPVRVAAGTVVLSAHAPGFFPLQRIATVAPGQLAHEQIEMIRMSAPVRTPAEGNAQATVVPPPQSGSSGGAPPGVAIAAKPTEAPGGTEPHLSNSGGQWQRPVAWVALGLAAASLGTGVTFHVLHQTRTDTYNRTDASGAHVCNRDVAGNFVGPNDCATAFNGAANARTLMIVGYSGAVLFGAASAILFLTAPSTDGAAGAATLRPDAVRGRRLACGMGPGVAGLACSGSF
jgi:hypothetical protein